MSDTLLETDFIREMVRQTRAIDRYGVRGSQSVDDLLEPYILTREKKAELPIIGDPDEETLARLRAFYNAIAILVEKECGLMASTVMEMSHEGFGRVLIIVGKLVALDRSLRDVHRFGFESLSKMKSEADAHLAVALERVGNHSGVAGL